MPRACDRGGATSGKTLHLDPGSRPPDWCRLPCAGDAVAVAVGLRDAARRA